MFVIIYAYAVAAALQEGQCGAKQQPMVRVHLLTRSAVFLACKHNIEVINKLQI